MKILLVPMAAMAETHGPSSRCKTLALGFRNAGIEAATCMAEDVNYKAIDGIKNYFLDVPMPMGLPKFIATKTFPIAQKLGITAKKTVNSFDQVLMFTGNLDYKYLKKSVASIRKAIKEYKPDVVYSEFNISAIVAAKKEKVPLYITVSYPTQHEYAHAAGLDKGLNRLLGELDLPKVESALQLFDWADKAFCPSIKEMEPIDKKNIIYCGSLKSKKTEPASEVKRNKIVVYMGNGTISADETLKVMKEAFGGSSFEVFIASSYLKEEQDGNIHVAPRWDFDKLLGEAVLFINHGGQNSIVDGLLSGVPQIILPGKIFERKYNAACVADNHAGAVLEPNEFKAERIKNVAGKIISSSEMTENAAELGRKLIQAGGIDTIVREVCLKE